MHFKKVLAYISAMVLCCGVISTPQIADTLTSIVASAEDEEYQYSGSCGENATYSFDEATGTLTISGTGDIDYTQNWRYGWDNYKERIKTVIIEDGITSISWNAFGYCTSLIEITIPDSVDEIAPYAFVDCTSLKEITIPNSVTIIWWSTFSGCSSLESVTIPNTVTRIGDHAFWKCTSLTNITIPNSVTYIEEYAFDSCTSLESITITNSVTYIGYETFSGCEKLTDVYFQGTEEEWNILEFHTNIGLTNATIHFDTSPTITDILNLKKYILGITADGTGLDFNADENVNILDLITALNEIHG